MTSRTVRDRQIEKHPWLVNPRFLAALGDLLPRLDEAQQRHLAGLLSIIVGYGRNTRIGEATELHPETVARGRRELHDGLADVPADRVRRKGAGRKPTTEDVPGIVDELAALVENDTGGDPQTGRKWTRRSTRRLAGELSERIGRAVSHETVRQLLKKGASR